MEVFTCREHCPKIKEFEEAKVALRQSLQTMGESEAQMQSTTSINRASRRMMSKLKPSTPEMHEALRTQSDAEFFTSEAKRQIEEARREIDNALQLQDDAIELCIQACPTGAPVEISAYQSNGVNLMCGMETFE